MTPPVEAAPVDVTPVDPVVALPVVVEAVPVATVTDSWELKYRVLEGKYRNEVPRLAQELRELKALQGVGGVDVTATPSAATGEARKRVTEQYGDDFASAVDSIASEQTAELRRQVEELGGGAAERARQDFRRDLSSHVPQWPAIDQDPGFTAYLDEFDAQTGRMRREFFNEADRTNNAARVASFFAAFTASGVPKPAPVAAVVRETQSVEHLISPDSSNHAEPAVVKKQWTRGEAARFYADARAQGSSAPHGRFTAAEYTRIDSDINAAIVEGRFVG